MLTDRRAAQMRPKDRQLKQLRRQKTAYDLEFLMSGPNGI